MTREPIRPLTPEEVELLKPELEAYTLGVQAQERLKRMVSLLGADELDLSNMTLLRVVPDEA